MRRRNAAAQAREIEEVSDEPVESLRLGANRRNEIVAICACELDLWVTETGRRSDDRRERRAEVVRDRMQHGGLDRVAPSTRLGLDRPLCRELRPSADLRCKHADDNAGDEVDGEREPV